VAENLDMLAADSDRATAADEMRQHYESGRLTLDEFESRLAEVYTARTRGDLETAFRQLPRREPPASLRLRDRRWSSLALQYALVNTVCILVWAFSGSQGGFWPKWVLLGTLIMFFRRLGRRSSRRGVPSARHSDGPLLHEVARRTSSDEREAER
jgi:fatty acid desaturase